MGRRRLTEPLLLVATLLTLLVAGEIGLRLGGWRRDFVRLSRVQAGTPRELGVCTLSANTVITHARSEFDVTYRTNSLGYFDREWPPKSAGTIRIAVLGDSFTMGNGVGAERAFPRLLGPALSAAAGVPVEGLNFGVWGTGTLHQREFLPDAIAAGADHVLFCTYVNDLFDNQRYLRVRAASGAARPEPQRPALSTSAFQRALVRIRAFFGERSLVFAFVMSRTRRIRNALGLVIYPMEIVFTGQSNHLIVEAANDFNSIGAELKRRGIPMSVVYLPARVQVMRERVPREFDLDLPNRLLGEHLDGPGWIDLTEDFRSDGSPDFWFDEGHLSARGHEFLAERIAAALGPSIRAPADTTAP